MDREQSGREVEVTSGASYGSYVAWRELVVMGCCFLTKEEWV